MTQCEQIWYTAKPSFFEESDDDGDWNFDDAFVKEQCQAEATVVAIRVGGPYPDLTGPINVCADHALDVEQMNWLNERIAEGTLFDE